MAKKGGREEESGGGRVGGAGVLYLCGTPIGNLEDVSFRAVRVLQEVDLIAAEDTRRTRRLCLRYKIGTRLTSFHRFNEAQRSRELLDVLRRGGDVALVSEAGTPGISDPGELLVRLAVQDGIRVVPVPGPSAAVLALVVSGLSTARFAFEGFLPRRRSQRRALFSRLKDERRTLILYEAPHRLLDSLEDLAWALGDRPVVVARELTKRFEEVLRGTAAELRARMAQAPLRGEITLVVAGAPGVPADQAAAGDGVHGPGEPGAIAGPEELRERVEALMRQGQTRTEAVKAVSRELGLPRSEVYRVTGVRGRKRDREPHCGRQTGAGRTDSPLP